MKNESKHTLTMDATDIQQALREYLYEKNIIPNHVEYTQIVLSSNDGAISAQLTYTE